MDDLLRPLVQPIRHTDDLVHAVLLLLVLLGAAAAIQFVGHVRATLRVRADIVRVETEAFPDTAAQARATARALRPLLRPLPRPADPFARRQRIEVPPYGDGRPGEAFWAPGPPLPLAPQDGKTQCLDVALDLCVEIRLVVACIGPLGAVRDGEVIGSAAERGSDTSDARVLADSLHRVETGAGAGWRKTYALDGTRQLTDTHVDHDGWAFVVGVLWSAGDVRALVACDALLETWEWLPDHGGHERRLSPPG